MSKANFANCWIESGPPGAPDGVTVEEITDSTAQLSWRPGQDNGSPIISYIIQTKTAFTVGWQAVNTGNNAGLAGAAQAKRQFSKRLKIAIEGFISFF